MNENINIQSIQSMHNIAIYAKDITLKRIDKVIVETQRDNPMLLELFADKFFSEVHKQLQAKKKIYNIYVMDLQNIEKIFDEQMNIADSRIDAQQMKYKDMLVASLAAFSILIAKLDIKIEEIQEKIEGKNYEESY